MKFGGDLKCVIVLNRFDQIKEGAPQADRLTATEKFRQHCSCYRVEGKESERHRRSSKEKEQEAENRTEPFES